MAAISDMGGRREHFGPIPREADEPVFHARWEGRVFGLSFPVFMIIRGNIDALRYAIERLPREQYMRSYYERWLAAFELVLVEKGYLAVGEVDARVEGRSTPSSGRRGGRLVGGAVSLLARMQRPRVPRFVARAMPRFMGTARPPLSKARFAAGQRVRVRFQQAEGHTRQPGYVTGKPGVVTVHQGAMLFPDARSVGRRSRPQHLYTVAFDGADLWGEDAEPDTEIRIDLFEPYLEPA